MISSDQNISVDQKELAQELADAISTGNILLIHDLLDEDGSYIIADSKLELYKSDKYGFLNWLGPLMKERNLSSENKLSFYFDQCLDCKIGNPVILFDEGKSPVKTIESWEREKLGLMIEIEDDVVSSISKCGVFEFNDNTSNFRNTCFQSNIKW